MKYKRKTVYAIWTKQKEVIGDFNSIDEVQACLDRMTRSDYKQVDHIFAREIKTQEVL